MAPHDIDRVEGPVSEFIVAVQGRLTTGEIFHRPERFRRLLKLSDVVLIQPVLIRVGGVTG